MSRPVFDALAVYFLDTIRTGRSQERTWFALRFGVALMVAAIDTIAIAPRTFRDAVSEYALQLHDANDAARQMNYDAQYKVGALEEAVAATDTTQAAAIAASKLIPVEVRVAQSKANSCAAELARERRRRADGTQAERHLAGLIADCSALAKQANEATTAFQAKARQDIHDATVQRSDAQRDLRTAEDTIRARLSDANRIEGHAITYRSLSVVGAYILSDPLAMIEIALLFAVSVALQFAPLALKSLVGRSAPGARIMADHEIAVAEHLRRRDEAFESQAQRMATNETFQAALADILSSSALRQQMAASLQPYVLAMTPFEVARHNAEAFEAFIAAWDEKTRRHPRFAEDFNRLFEAAMKDVAQALRPAAA